MLHAQQLDVTHRFKRLLKRSGMVLLEAEMLCKTVCIPPAIMPSWPARSSANDCTSMQRAVRRWRRSDGVDGTADMRLETRTQALNTENTRVGRTTTPEQEGGEVKAADQQ